MTPSTAIRFEIDEQLARLSFELQKKVLEFTRSLSPAKSARGSELLEFAGRIPASECAAMTRAIQEGCESVDPHGW